MVSYASNGKKDDYAVTDCTIKISLTLLTALVIAVAVAVQEPEDQDVLADLEKKFLASLGMKQRPDLRNANISDEYVQRMTRRYYKKLRKSEQELRTYQHTGFDENNNLIFNPDLEHLRNLEWARLRFSNSTSMDITPTLREWKESSTNALQVECRETSCHRAELQIMARKSRENQPPCNGGCCMKPLNISFKELAWDWIVQPEVFEAFHCKGPCSKVSDNFASTYAMMKMIINQKGRKGIRPCCAPRKLKGLDILHYNEKTPPELVVTRQKGMKVKECACI